jgi:hypothetical protein
MGAFRCLFPFLQVNRRSTAYSSCEFSIMADPTAKEMQQHVESGSDKDAYELGGKEERGTTDHTAGTFTYGIDAAHQKKVM